MLQQTIQKSVTTSGIGLHSGKQVELTLSPAPENTGIVFRIHHEGRIHEISPTPESVQATSLATTLGVNGATISTVEHLLASIIGLSIDNIYIDVIGGEIPIVDGSAAPFIILFNSAGIITQKAERSVVKIKKACSFEREGKSIVVKPYNGLFVDYTIHFDHPRIGTQHIAMEITPENFKTIAKARTFGFIKEIEYLRSKNLTLGGSLENAIVLDEETILNKEGLRYTDEFIRHKLLDFIGDIGMLGKHIFGHFTVHCSGHALNNQFLRYLCENAEEYLVECMPSAISQELPKEALHTNAVAGFASSNS